MRFTRSKRFDKHFEKLSVPVRTRVSSRLSAFAANPHDPLLNNHALRGEYEGCRSINAGGDMRVVYEPIAPGVCKLIDVGTHSELYGA